MTPRARAGCALLLAGLALALVGCAGEGIPDPIGPAPACTDVAPFRPELHCIQQFVFSPSCAKVGCHVNPGAQQGMDLSDGLAWSNIVGVASAEDPNLNRVQPGDPDNSYLVLKLEGSPRILGGQMPQDGPPFLSQAEIDAIRQWILDGAQDN